MPDFANLSYQKSGAIATLTIDRPKALNALNRATLAEFQTALQDAASDSSVHGVIVTGAGDKAFAAGADIPEIASATPLQAQAFTRQGQASSTSSKRWASRSSQPSTATRWAAVASSPWHARCASLQRMPASGSPRSSWASCQDSAVPSDCCIGLVNEVVEPARLMARAEELLLQIIANAPLAVRLSMAAVHQGLEAGQAQGLALESASFALCASTEDKRAGTQAFLERRLPRFSGQ